MTALANGPALAAVQSPAPRVAWSRCCDDDDTSLVTQTPQWSDSMVASNRWVDASRHYSFDDGREFVLPLVRRTGLGSRAPHHSMPEAWGFGGLVGAGIDADAVRRVFEDLRTLDAGWIRVRPNPLHAAAWDAGALHAGGTRTIKRRAHVLRLDAEPDEIFRSRFTSAARRAVRSAEKSGLTVDAGSGPELVGVFYRLFLRSVERWAAFQHEPLALAQWRAGRRDPEEKFNDWIRSLGAGCRILIARRDDVPIAAIVVLQGRNAHMTRGAMDRELVGHDRPNELLMWHAISHATRSGCTWFHFGESGESESLSRYKEKYGARPFDYLEHRVERLPATAVDLALRGAVKRVIGFRDS